MVLFVELVPVLLTAMSFLSPRGVRAIKADHMGSYGPAFYQSYDASGQFTHEFDGEQIFSVDLKNEEVVWRLPEFGDFAHSDFQSGLMSISMIKAHLDILVERSNRTRAVSVPPRVTVLPKTRVELGKPNVLICIVDDIFPPVINVTWLRNSQPITKGVAQTSFYSQPNHRFRKFHYLTFVPSAEDVYDCKVEHWGLDTPLLQHWEPQVLTPPPDTIETLICGLGLVLGLMGCLLGTVLMITGTRRPSIRRLKPIQKMEGVANGVAVGQQSTGLSDISAQVQQYQQFLDASRSLPDFAELDLQGKVLPEGVGPGDIKAFQVLYREHCEAIVDVMVNLQFTLVETLWKTFWRYNLSQPSEAPPLAVHDEAEKRLPRASLVLLSKFQPVLQWTKHCDNVLYQGLVEILIPDVLRPIPSALTQAIRNFAKSLESWLTHAMVNIPEEMLRVKVAAAGAFAQTLRRYTSLNHLAQAARAVLQNTAQINQMLSDLNRVDFANVQEQASWVCRCEDRVVQRLEQDFKVTLQQQNSLEQWAAWLDGVVSQVLKPYQGSSGFPKAAKLFLLKWSFYSSMVIRDLTLRSAASFGSFHLIRLLYDEYMYYLIEHRVAQAKGETPIAVMGEFANLATSLNPLDPDKDEEEEEEEESEDELPQDISLAAGSESPALGPEALEPPAKLARTDTRGLFVQALPSS